MKDINGDGSSTDTEELWQWQNNLEDLEAYEDYYLDYMRRHGRECSREDAMRNTNRILDGCILESKEKEAAAWDQLKTALRELMALQQEMELVPVLASGGGRGSNENNGGDSVSSAESEDEDEQMGEEESDQEEESDMDEDMEEDEDDGVFNEPSPKRQRNK